MLSLAIVLALATSPVDPMTAAYTWQDSLTYSAQLSRCKKVLPDSAADLDDAFAKWRSANAETIRAGEDAIRKEGIRTRTDTIAMVKDTTAWLESEMAKKPNDDQVRGCTAMLGKLKGAN